MFNCRSRTPFGGEWSVQKPLRLDRHGYRHFAAIAGRLLVPTLLVC